MINIYELIIKIADNGDRIFEIIKNYPDTNTSFNDRRIAVTENIVAIISNSKALKSFADNTKYQQGWNYITTKEDREVVKEISDIFLKIHINDEDLNRLASYDAYARPVLEKIFNYTIIDQMVADLTEARKNLDQIKNETNNNKYSVIETMGVFFALFALIATQVNIFSNLQTFQQALVISVVIYSSILSLILVLFTFTRNMNRWYLALPIIFIASVLSITGYFIYTKQDSNLIPECSLAQKNTRDCIVKKDFIDKMIEYEVDKKIQEKAEADKKNQNKSEMQSN